MDFGRHIFDDFIDMQCRVVLVISHGGARSVGGQSDNVVAALRVMAVAGVGAEAGVTRCYGIELRLRRRRRNRGVGILLGILSESTEFRLNVWIEVCSRVRQCGRLIRRHDDVVEYAFVEHRLTIRSVNGCLHYWWTSPSIRSRIRSRSMRSRRVNCSGIEYVLVAAAVDRGHGHVVLMCYLVVQLIASFHLDVVLQGGRETADGVRSAAITTIAIDYVGGSVDRPGIANLVAGRLALV